MNDQLFRDVLRALLSAAEERRDKAREQNDGEARDLWSAVAGNLDNARQRMRK